MKHLFAYTILAGISALSLHAQFVAIGFEGPTISNIPYATNVGIPSGTATNTPFNYTFRSGNNLQSFQSGSEGNIADTDDVFSGSGSSSTIPDYHKSPEFGWQLSGWQSTNNTSPQWGIYDPTFSGNGANGGADYTGLTPPRSRTELGEALNLNRYFSPANGNLPSAPGLGDQFLDTHGKATFTSQIFLDFRPQQSALYWMTLAFGGRDANSQNQRGYFRLLQGNTVVFSGSTSDTPTEAWKPINTSNPSAGSQTDNAPASTGVTQQAWEYYKPANFNVVGGTLYRLEVLLPEEHNFDIAIGNQYTNVPFIEIVPVPEPATYGAFAAAGLVGFAAFRRRASRRR